MLSLKRVFPLQRVTDADLQQLCQTLWSWQTCIDCTSNKKCESKTCPSYRWKRLKPYFDFYKQQAQSYSPEIQGTGTPILNSHHDLLQVVLKLQKAPDKKKGETAMELLDDSVDSSPSTALEKDQVINIAVRVMLVATCGIQSSSLVDLESGNYLQPWKEDTSLVAFINECFPTTDHPSLNDINSTSSRSMKEALTAVKLRKRAGLRFYPTDNLRRHLELNRKKGTVFIFHHTAFLKEQLRRTHSLAPLSLCDSLKVGTVPRQLALEILDSIQKILFPLEDEKSKSLLESLTASGGGGFDPDCCRFEVPSIRKDDEKDVPYYYFGERLVDLYEELQNPTPRGGFEKWLQRWSNARYVMLATLIGVVTAVVLGLAGLCISSYQTWITYQAWRHPVLING